MLATSDSSNPDDHRQLEDYVLQTVYFIATSLHYILLLQACALHAVWPSEESHSQMDAESPGLPAILKFNTCSAEAGDHQPAEFNERARLCPHPGPQKAPNAGQPHLRACHGKHPPPPFPLKATSFEPIAAADTRSSPF